MSPQLNFRFWHPTKKQNNIFVCISKVIFPNHTSSLLTLSFCHGRTREATRLPSESGLAMMRKRSEEAELVTAQGQDFPCEESEIVCSLFIQLEKKLCESECDRIFALTKMQRVSPLNPSPPLRKLTKMLVGQAQILHSSIDFYHHIIFNK